MVSYSRNRVSLGLGLALSSCLVLQSDTLSLPGSGILPSTLRPSWFMVSWSHTWCSSVSAGKVQSFGSCSQGHLSLMQPWQLARDVPHPHPRPISRLLEALEGGRVWSVGGWGGGHGEWLVRWPWRSQLVILWNWWFGFITLLVPGDKHFTIWVK